MASKNGGSTTIKERIKTTKGSSFNLSNAPLVMIWRRVSSFKQPQSLAIRGAALKKIGSNAYAVMYDAGNSLIGYWVQEQFIQQNLDEPQMVASCCDYNFQRFALVSNPAMELTFAPPNFKTATTKLGSQFKLAPAISKTDLGESLSFVDEDGNFSSYFQLGRISSSNRVGERLKTYVTGGEKAHSKTAGSLVGYNLLVADLKASTKFYKDVLGLRLLKSTREESIFDVGTMLLSLKSEPAMGLVRSLAKAGRLLGDWAMFHVNDIDEAAGALSKRGVKFPLGIERSAHGQGALFNDPDGHTLTVWQPPNEPTDINYFPQLKRILESVS